MSGDPYFNRPTVRQLDTRALGPIRLESRPLTAIIRGIVQRGHADREVDPETIDVIVVGTTRFVREGRS